MDKIDCIKAFVVTARLNSFTLASEELDTTQSAVSKKNCVAREQLKAHPFSAQQPKDLINPGRKRLSTILFATIRRDEQFRS